MRFNRILPAMLIALSATLLQSCLKDQEDIFDEPTSLRVQEVLDNTKKVLTSSDNGWVFEYYPDRNIKYGGYIYTVKFDDAQATVGCELAPGVFETSLYKMKGDNGPTLTFDSYNTLMHFFSTPSSGHYEAYDGDFEFAIMDVTDNVIKLRGKRTGNIMYMRRLEGDAAQYIDAVAAMSDNMFLTSASGTVGSAAVEVGIDLDVRYMAIAWGEGEDQYDGNYFLPTPTGIRFMSPVTVGDATVEELVYDPDNMVYSGTDSKGNAVSLAGTLPATYTKFEEYAGEFTIYFNPGGDPSTVDVTLVPDKANNRYLIKGLNDNYDVVAMFKKSLGVLEICSQQVAVDDSNGQLIWFCAWGINPATGSGSITWDETAGMYIIKDPETPGAYEFTSNGYAELGYPPNSFAAYYFTGTVGGQPRGQAARKWRVNGGDGYQMTYIETMVKK